MSHSLWSNIRTLKSQERQRSWSQDLQSPRSETYFTISRWQQSCESWVFILSLKITSCKNQVLFSTFQMWRFQYQRGKNSLRWRQDSIWTQEDLDETRLRLFSFAAKHFNSVICLKRMSFWNHLQTFCLQTEGRTSARLRNLCKETVEKSQLILDRKNYSERNWKRNQRTRRQNVSENHRRRLRWWRWWQIFSTVRMLLLSPDLQFRNILRFLILQQFL